MIYMMRTTNLQLSHEYNKFKAVILCLRPESSAAIIDFV